VRIFVHPILVILLGLLVLWLGSRAYAMDESGNVTWELVYISADHGCTPFQYQMANAYDEMTSKYFDLYKFGNSHHPSQCMADKKYSSYKAPKDVDLLVLVYDDQIANVELHPNDVGGFYTHIGQDRTKNHVIVVCDCSNFEFATPTWTLSHELSHFITYYLGFGLEVQNQIHQNAAKYDTCIEIHWDNSTCSGIITRVYGDNYFTWANVMVPYQPAVDKMSTVNNDTSGTSNNIANSQVVMGIQKEITKWWLDGTINDTQYAKVLGYIVTKPDVITNGTMPANVLLASGRDGEEENSTYYNLGTQQNEKTGVLLKRVPFKLENVSLPNGIIPPWFKTLASGWEYNESLSNQDFVDKIRHLFGLVGK
jgi:hypothetical protein